MSNNRIVIVYNIKRYSILLIDTITSSLPGELQVYRNVDSVTMGDVNSNKNLHTTTEFLNKENLSGLPPHLLTAKVGTMMVLFRDLTSKMIKVYTCVSSTEFLNKENPSGLPASTSSEC